MANSAPTIDELREQHEAAILRLETKQLLAAAGMPLVEGETWGDFVDRREYLTDDPSWGRSGMVYYTNISDRTDGRFRPIYETEVDLSRIRGAVRNLYSLTPILTGAQDSLANYVLGTGMQFGAKPADESDLQAALVAGKVQEIIDRFCDDTDFAGVVDREAHNRSREDGEAFLRLVVEQGQIGVEFIEADQVTEPAAPRELEDWLDTGSSCWKFGVHTAHGNTSKPLGYHIVRDGVGNDWDYVEADRMEHIKRNVTRNAKRGVSDFYPVLGDLEREAKLRRNMVQGAALQSAIAWIMQGAPGQTSAQLSNLGSADRLLQYNRKSGPGGVDKTQNVNNFPPGSIIRAGYGQEYKPGPMGAERNAGFELVAQYALRAIGVRWNMPEYLISGDASNGNYASSMVAEAPFVKAREADQQFYKRHFLSLLWKVVKIHFDSGRLSRFGLTWDQLKQAVRLEATAPVVANRDPAQQADTHDKQLRNGMISMQTAREQAGLDHTQEETRGAVKEQPPVMPFGMPGANPFAVQPVAESFQESADTSENDGRWITMNGEHVLVNSKGTIVDGPKHLRGTKVGASSDSESSKETITGAAKKLEKHGYTIHGVGTYDLKNKQAMYHVSGPDGVKKLASAVHIKELLQSLGEIPDKIAGAIDTAGNAVADFSRKHMESTLTAAVTAALESVETTYEARGVLAQLTEVYP